MFSKLTQWLEDSDKKFFESIKETEERNKIYQQLRWKRSGQLFFEIIGGLLFIFAFIYSSSASSQSLFVTLLFLLGYSFAFYKADTKIKIIMMMNALEAGKDKE